MHLVRMSRVMGSLESGRVGRDRWIPLINIAVWEFLISGDGVPYHSLWKNWIPLMLLLMELTWRLLMLLRKEIKEVIESRENSGNGML